jgi:DNA-binding CsgD family transcriptional regulator
MVMFDLTSTPPPATSGESLDRHSRWMVPSGLTSAPDAIFGPDPSVGATQGPLGRERELGCLRDFLGSLNDVGSSALVWGERGVGRSTLLQAAADMAQTSGMTVLTSSGGASGAQVEYETLHRLLHPLVRHLTGLSESHREALSDALGLGRGQLPPTLLLYNAVLALLRVTAEERPLVLIVDDIEHIDAASLAVLSFVAQQRTEIRVGILASAQRPDELPAELRLAVEPLDRTDAEHLIERWEPSIPTYVRSALIEQADGNPLALLEQLRSLQRNHRQSLSGSPLHANRSRRGTPPYSVELDLLPGRTRQALLTLALDARADLLCLTEAGLDVSDLDPAERAGLARVDIGTFTLRFEHPLVRSTITLLATVTERRTAHLALAARAGATLEERAFHLDEASTDPDEEIATLLETVAEAAMSRGDSQTASHALERAAKLSPAADQRKRRLAKAAYVAVDMPSEPGLYSSRPQGDFHSEASAGSMYEAIASAFAQLEGGMGSRIACSTVGDAVQARLRGSKLMDTELEDALNAWMYFCRCAGTKSNWDVFVQALKRVRPGPPESMRTLARVLADPINASPRDRERLRDMLLEIDAETKVGQVLRLFTASTLFDLQEVTLPAAWRLIENGRMKEPTLTYARALVHVAFFDFESGRWSEAHELVREGLIAANRIRVNPVLGALYYVAALLAAAEGEPARVGEITLQLDNLGSRLDSLALQRCASQARALNGASRMDWETVYRHASTLSGVNRIDFASPQALWTAYDLVDSAMRTGRTETARSHCVAMARAELSMISPRIALVTYAAQGLVADDDSWRGAFEQALAVPQADDWPFEFARVELDFGSRLRRERRPREAREWLCRALSGFEKLGAQPWALRARNELRAAREHMDVGAMEQVLTAQELAVAELAAEGFSNKQIGQRLYISARTAGGHLYRVFPKLGVTSRSALRDALVSLDQVHDDR